MKVSEIVASTLCEYGVDRVFGVSGGASLHLLSAIHENPEISLTCMHHEQSVAMAAEAYSRLSGKLGVGIVTSGPGATNLITGIAGAYYDSIPAIFITGQVSTTRMKGSRGVRQLGFQETPIVEMVKEITKYARTITRPEDVENELRSALTVALSGRKGPVLIDIPDDIQRKEIASGSRKSLITFTEKLPTIEPRLINNFYSIVKSAKKPIIICGAGIQLSSKRNLLINSLERWAVPTALTWGAKDLLPADKNYLLGTFGTHGDRFVNIALNEADLLISIGSRLDLKATGSPPATFAPKAKKIMLDVDCAEIRKFDESGLEIAESIILDFETGIFDQILSQLTFDMDIVANWKSTLFNMKSSMPKEKRHFSGTGVNPYLFIESLSEKVKEPANLIIDTGCAIAWTMQAWKTRENQRIFHDFNNTAMGWSIPASIASVFADPKRLHLCIIGDGSIMMSLSDLSTLVSTGNSIKVFVLNNSGYAMIKQTQDQWFNGRYFASDASSHLHFPSFRKIAEATGLVYYSITSDNSISEVLEQVLREPNPSLIEVFIQPSARVVPIVKFGNPNHIMEPETSDQNK